MSISKDPRRLVEYGDRLDGLLRGALDAERAESAGDAARLARIGRRIAEATAAAPPPPPTPAAPSAKPAALAAKGPIIGVAAATLAGLVAIAIVASQSPSAPPPAPAPVTRTTAAPPTPEPAPVNTTEAVPTVSPADLPSAPERPVANAKAPTSAKAAAPSEADEIALLGRAHDALRTSPAESLSLCKEHEAKYAGGHFAQEREAVAIEALVYLHRTDEARRRFAEFERRWPTSSHRVHLESLLPR